MRRKDSSRLPLPIENINAGCDRSDIGSEAQTEGANPFLPTTIHTIEATDDNQITMQERVLIRVISLLLRGLHPDHGITVLSSLLATAVAEIAENEEQLKRIADFITKSIVKYLRKELNRRPH